MKGISKLISFLFLINVGFAQEYTKKQNQVKLVLDTWHKAAATADYDTYFNLMTADAIFIGTDASENWSKSAFESFSKPYFDTGKAWAFTCVERTIFCRKKMAWFDELLSTQMGICRGSGVLMKTKKGWKIKHYVLSITIPNENVDSVVDLKSNHDKNLINKKKRDE